MPTSRERQDVLRKDFDPKFKSGRGKSIIEEAQLEELGIDLYMAPSGKDQNDSKGDNYLRFVPYKDIKKTFWFYVPVYYGVGTGLDQFICLQRMWKEKCPICEERTRKIDEGIAWKDDNLRPYKWTTRCMLWVIDAYNKESEEEGVKLYIAPKCIMQDGVLPLIKDPRTQEVIDPSDAGENMVFYFNKSGERLGTEYKGYKLLQGKSDIRELTNKELDIREFKDILHHPTYEEVRESLVGYSPTDNSEERDMPGDRKRDYEDADKAAEVDDKPEDVEEEPKAERQRRGSKRAEEIKDRESGDRDSADSERGARRRGSRERR